MDSASSTASELVGKRTNSSIVIGTTKRRRLSEVSNVLLQINPTGYARAAFRANGHDVDSIETLASERFTPPTKEMMEAYQGDVVAAFRNNDMDAIEGMHATGRLTVNACNRFGESVLHIACRRGNARLVRFLIETVGLDVRTIRDDYHRTAMHDACWTNRSASDVMDVLLEYAPEHLLLRDVRGYTPLDYVRTEDQGRWLRFLWERKARLNPSWSSPCADTITVTPGTITE
jgi:Ankyrin repeats (3 copies)